MTDPQRSRDCANRARVLAVGCERDARRVAELFAWAEYADRAAAEAEERAEAEATERAEAPADVPLGTTPEATGSRVVPVAECIARAEAEAARLDVIARERNAWAVDMRALFVNVHEGCNVLGVNVADARSWSSTAASAAASAAKDADRARWEAERWTRDAERSAADMEAVRARTARLFSGEGDVRSRWVSTDGRTVVALALPTEADIVTESDARFADVLSGAVAAKDAGRPLKSTDVPSKAKHGRGLGTEFKQAVARASRPLVQPWKAPRIPAEGKPLDGAALAILDADGVCAEVEAAPGVWLPRAAVCLSETASANGWTVAMERHGSGIVIVRAAGVLARAAGPVAGEVVAVWTAGMYDAHRSGALVAGLWRDGAAELSQVLTTIGQSAEAGEIATAEAEAEAGAEAEAEAEAGAEAEAEAGAEAEAEAGAEAEAEAARERAPPPPRKKGREDNLFPKGEEVSAAASADPPPLTCSGRAQRIRPWQLVEQLVKQPVTQPARQPVGPPAEQPQWIRIRQPCPGRHHFAAHLSLMALRILEVTPPYDAPGVEAAQPSVPRGFRRFRCHARPDDQRGHGR
ncbi:hypothetical protein [Streptomyces sp. ITFR-6]|uniref:hypothetical protein n=1 Tax=Streptomyces sp. ITFR-6 TaxID=3075197 RepID=UPI00288B1BEF|nr:hypothetical protein [Streptomyces sp. ITFR-6]WNI34474.1 hypothetical protein RLT59_38315 [Streptomyces sp. ITFR-6]